MSSDLQNAEHIYILTKATVAQKGLFLMIINVLNIAMFLKSAKHPVVYSPETRILQFLGFSFMFFLSNKLQSEPSPFQLKSAQS